MNIFWRGAAFALVATFGAAATSQTIASGAHSGDDITLAAWSARVIDGVGRHLDYPRGTFSQQEMEGIVRVKFLCSETGAPDGIEVLKSSGYRPLDRAALTAIKRIVTLHPLPKGMAHDQKYEAVILFASSEDSAFRLQQKEMQRDALRRNEWFEKKHQQSETASANPIILYAAP
ncbi:MAG: TonB family protein [Sphingomonas bacterium]|jgi:protein TonB|nr:TonB family protein [Sphingomonas bacterium]